MRRPTFARAMESILASLRFQTDFHLASAAAIAVKSLANPNTPPDESTTRYIAELLRLAHLRQRFPTLPDSPAPEDEPEEKQPQITEREWVYQINGEKGLKAYDEFIALKAQYNQEQEHAQAQAQNQRPPPPTDNGPLTTDT
jgi:hypothetical protein